MQSRPSGFLDGLPPDLFEKRMTMKARSSGRGFMSGHGADGRRGGHDGRSKWSFRGPGEREKDSVEWGDSAATRRPGTPVSFSGAARRPAPAPDPRRSRRTRRILVAGARVRHRKFGAGTIAEIAGSGRDAKVRIDFDDETVGRKTLVVAQANLEREWD
jgi:DNA helicase-2/ATP-dependent DNA helicase PcrA